jgi:hypothetical protein
MSDDARTDGIGMEEDADAGQSQQEPGAAPSSDAAARACATATSALC